MTKYLLLCLMAIATFISCQDDDAEKADEGYFAIANRASGDVAIYSSEDQERVETLVIPDENAAPTYVVFSPENEAIYVSDFNTSKVWVYDSNSLEFETSFDAQEGGFHMWVNDRVDQVWVNNIVSKTTSVIDTKTGATLATIPLEAPDVVFARDAAQHDVIISPNGRFAYVSIFSQIGQNYVLQYSTSTFEVLRVEEVGGDPHLSADRRNLYVLSQDDSSIIEYNFGDLTPTGREAEFANVHGVTNRGNRGLIVTDISGKRVGSFERSSASINDAIDAVSPTGVSHNVAYSRLDGVVALANSGGNNVEFFEVDRRGNLEFLSVDESGGNPFGIFYFESSFSDDDDD